MKAINKKLLDLTEDGNLQEIKRIENLKHIDFTSVRKDNTSLLSMFVELENDSLYYIKKCLNAGVDINHENNQGTTALHIASLSNKPELVDFLINQNAKYDTESYASLVVMKQLLNQKNELIICRLLEIVEDYSILKTNLNGLSGIDFDYLDNIKNKVDFIDKINNNLPEKL